jgi:cytochrome c2
MAEHRSDQVELKRRAEAITGGRVDRGERAFTRYGCGSCHQVAGVPQADGRVGPPLDGIAGRAIIAGRLENEPRNLSRWIEHPQQVNPGTAMPELSVTPGDARDIAAFLYTRS